MTSTNAPAQITLSFSRSAGIVAMTTGEKYPWAQTALESTGFQRRQDGTYALPVEDPQAAQATMVELLRAADRHQSVVKMSGRPFIGDVAEGIAAQLPGRWSVTVDAYSHPVWQEDLVPLLWDAGELAQAVQNARIACAAVLGPPPRHYGGDHSCQAGDGAPHIIRQHPCTSARLGGEKRHEKFTPS
ncbi:hypothetical protein ABZ442_24960 [Streptomyces triculaminicus]|uniref:hypothetical protein n=1 Tax=Streptomyces triculaminicus TaxID=2816232 RepID=UPI0033EC647C